MQNTLSKTHLILILYLLIKCKVRTNKIYKIIRNIKIEK